ncbi:MAG: class II aldolase/adducin family protein [Anaerolineae bacterium]|nr:class II aldolase/adducin family protein [Anaerolineae bacterium]
MTELDPRPRIAEVGRLMFQRMLTNSAGGNISVRLGERIYITPKYAGSRNLWNLRPEQINVLTLAHELVDGPGDLSRESKMHFAVLQAYADVGAVIHAHPRFASVFAVAGKPIVPTLEYTDKFGLIEVVRQLPAHSQELGEAVVAALAPKREKLAKHGLPLILAKHGVVTVGRTLEDAFDTLERMEWSAHVLLMARLLPEG